MSKIRSIKALQILDSRGVPSLEVEIETTEGIKSSASVPSGASKGTHEAFEKRDENPNIFFGKSLYRNIEIIESEINDELLGFDIFDQKKIDEKLITLDGTKNKSRLGANSILAVSIAAFKSAAKAKKIPIYKNFDLDAKFLPIPFVNVINGGAHADNNCSIQEFMIVPKGFESFSMAIRASCEVFFCLKNILKEKNLFTNVGDEGGFAPNLSSNEEAIELILSAIKKSGYEEGKEIFLALDIAASQFCFENKFFLEKNDKNYLSKEKMIELYQNWCKKYPIISIEDPFVEDDFESFSDLTKILKGVQIVGDDIFVSQKKRLMEGINKGSANSILIKPNQVGTISETLETIKIAKENNYKTIISHRSADTEDSFIADLAVGTSSMQIKTGSMSRSERISKYNRLLYIEKELGKKSIYSGLV